MKVLISTWKPWRLVRGADPDQRVAQAKDCGAGLCLKGSDGAGLYGMESWGIFRLPQYEGKSNDHIERLAKASGLPVDLWCFVYLRDPIREARAVQDACKRWNPSELFLDAEETRFGGAKRYAANTGAFLRSLGRLPTGSVWLQSYRRPDLHPELAWTKWLGYRDAAGRFLIDGLAPQAYPVGSRNYISDFDRMLLENERLLRTLGRPELPYFMTLPAYEERGWRPDAEQLQRGVDFLAARLGERLAGLNFWRQQYLFFPEFKEILELARWAAQLPGNQPQQPPTLEQITARLSRLEGEARGRGWPV